MLALVYSYMLAAEEIKIGRLFTIPSERAHLDALRNAEKKPTTKADRLPYVNIKKNKAEQNQFYLQGVVIRSDGSNMLWTNNGDVLENGNKDDSVIFMPDTDDPAQVILTLPDKQTLKIKPGQIYDPKTDKIRESYETRN